MGRAKEVWSPFYTVEGPYTFVTLDGPEQECPPPFCAQEYYKEWNMEGSCYRLQFRSNTGTNTVTRDGVPVANGKFRTWSLWGDMIYHCHVGGVQSSLVARRKFFKPNSVFTCENMMVARAYINLTFTEIRLEYLFDSTIFLPITLADVFYTADPRKQET
jgi:hypothetical protein